MKLMFASLLLVSLLSQTASALPPARQDKDYWADTELKINHFQRDILGECNDSANALLGCVNGLNLLASTAEPATVYATEEEKKTQITIGALLEAGSDGLNLYLLNTKAKLEGTTAQKIAAWKAARAAHEKAIVNLYAQNEAIRAEVNFATKVQTAYSKAKPETLSTRESSLAAAMYNEYFHTVYDPHSELIAKARFDEMMNQPVESFVGIGVIFGKLGESFVVNRVLDKGPAMKAGFRKGDLLISVDGHDLSKVIDTDEVRKYILGNEGTQVKMVIKRGEKNLELVVTRGKIVSDTVTAQVVSHLGTSYGYITLSDFMDRQGSNKVKAAILELESKVNGFILDLRGNGGGLIGVAAEIGGLFVGQKVITIQKLLHIPENQGGAIRIKSNWNQITKKPLAILVDSGSASASELLSGAIQDYGRGWIVGDRTFGKGSVQGTYEFALHSRDLQERSLEIYSSIAYSKSNLVQMKQTIARFYQPSNRTNQLVGIVPDFAVAASLKPDPNVVAEREEDEYSNALAALGKPWVQPNKRSVALVDDCRTNGKEADQAFTRLDSELANGADYQLLSAEEILKCAAKTGATERSVVNE